MDALKAEYQELKKFMDSTDWYVIRKSERSIDIPEEISKARAEKISRINAIMLYVTFPE